MNDSLAKECRGNGGATVKCNGTIGEMTHGKSAMNWPRFSCKQWRVAERMPMMCGIR